METQYLRTLCAVIDKGSYSKAANDLNITQSAVSQRIKFLEDRYGMSLIERTSNGFTLTEAGNLVVNKAKQILLLEKELENDLKGLGSKKRLSLCSTPTFGVVYLPKILNRFFLANSADMDFKFVLNSPEQSLKGLLENEFDLAIIEHCGSIDIKESTIHRLSDDELIFISSPTLSLSHPVISIDELLKQRLITRREGCSSRCLLQENLKRLKRSLDDFSSMIIYDDLHLTIQNVLDGRGVAFVSKSLVHDYLVNQILIGHTVKGFECFRSRSIILPNRSRENLVLLDFIKSVLEVFNMNIADTNLIAAHK